MTSNSPKWVILTNSDKTLAIYDACCMVVRRRENYNVNCNFFNVVTSHNIQLIRTSDMIKNFNQVGFPLEKKLLIAFTCRNFVAHDK